jgi:NACHT domain
MRRRVRAAGWGLLALAIVAVAAVVTAGALRAHGDAAFNRWVGWATIAAVPLAAVGVVLVVWEKIARGATSDETSIVETEDQLAAVVLAQAQGERSRLIGAGEPSDQAANVRFVKGSGRFREVGGATSGDLVSVLEYYKSLSPRRLVVLGEPGAGKTVLAMELLIQLLEGRPQDTSLPVPVLISAAAYDTVLSWEEWLAKHLALRFGIGAGAAARLVRDGRILPLVDGVDEMDSTDEPERARVMVRALNAWMRGRERAPIVVTCRRVEYKALARPVDRATHVEMIPLTGDEADDYLRDQFLNQDEQQRWEPVLASLDADPDGLMARQLATPWRLTLALAAFRDAGDPSWLLPAAPKLEGSTAQAYMKQVDDLLLSRYIPSSVRLNDLAGHYSEHQVYQWLTALADGLRQQIHRGGSGTDIQLYQWWRSVGVKLNYIIYLILIIVVASPWFIDAAVEENFFPAIVGILIIAAQVGGIAINLNPSPRQLKIRKIITRRGLLRVAIGLGFGPLFVLEFFVLNKLSGQNPTDGLTTALVAGIAFGLLMGMATGLLESAPKAVRPRDVIRTDGRYGLVVGIAFALLGFIFTVPTGLRYGLLGALSFGLAAFTNAAGAWTRYHISVIVIASRQQGPLRFGAFLDWAQEAGLLRVSGIAYQFRHRQLQDWLIQVLQEQSAATAPHDIAPV